MEGHGVGKRGGIFCCVRNGGSIGDIVAWRDVVRDIGRTPAPPQELFRSCVEGELIVAKNERSLTIRGTQPFNKSIMECLELIP